MTFIFSEAESQHQYSQVRHQNPKPTFVSVPTSVLNVWRLNVTVLNINSSKIIKTMNQASMTQTRQKKFLVFFQNIWILLNSLPLSQNMLNSLTLSLRQFRIDPFPGNTQISLPTYPKYPTNVFLGQQPTTHSLCRLTTEWAQAPPTQQLWASMLKL